jgi:hypothetical protein
MSRNETLGYREYWEPHPDLDPILAEEAHKAIARLPLSHLIHPVDGEIFSVPEAALEIEAAKEQDEILEDTRITRSAITIDDEDEEITIDDLPPPSTAPAALGGRSKRARASTVNYRKLAGITTRRTRKEIERLNQEAERKKKEKAAEMALRSPVKKNRDSSMRRRLRGSDCKIQHYPIRWQIVHFLPSRLDRLTF